jgi:hypothetical protein
MNKYLGVGRWQSLPPPSGSYTPTQEKISTISPICVPRATSEMIPPVEIQRQAANSIIVPTQPPLADRQVVITQTITYPDSTLTAVVTLGNGGSQTNTAAAPPVSDSPTSTGSAPESSSASGGLSQQQIGIIVGCCVGAAILIVIIWCCVAASRRKKDSDSLTSYYSYYTSSYFSDITMPRDTRWPAWRSVTPPVVPMYRARPPIPQWTANARASTTYVRR